MLELTVKIILIGGLLGMGFMIFRKIPALRELAEVDIESFERKGEILNLSKISSKTISFLGELRSKFKDLKKEKKEEEKEVNLSDDYWDKIRRG